MPCFLFAMTARLPGIVTIFPSSLFSAQNGMDVAHLPSPYILCIRIRLPSLDFFGKLEVFQPCL